MGLPSAENLYSYSPSTAAAVAFTVLYSALLAYHFYLSVLYARQQREKHRYTIALVVAAFLSAVGYATRIASIKSPGLDNVSIYATSASLIVISPIFVCASLYLQLAKLIRLCLPNDQQSFFGLRRIGLIFVTSDVFSFLTQASGSGIASAANWEGSLKDVGTNVILAGLALQAATFGFFIVILWQFICRVRNTASFDNRVRRVLVGAWVAATFVQVSVTSICATCQLIIIQTRTLYRVIEFALGIEGHFFQHEWSLYVLESGPMLIALAVLGWYHPIKWLQQGNEFEMVVNTLKD